MRLAKLEPHVVLPMTDGGDVDLFLKEVEEESLQAEPVSTASAEADIRAEEENLSHLMEFLSRRRKKKVSPQSRLGVALYRYDLQKSAFINSAEREVAELAKFRKIA